jgi:hypothetical protein
MKGIGPRPAIRAIPENDAVTGKTAFDAMCAKKDLACAASGSFSNGRDGVHPDAIIADTASSNARTRVVSPLTSLAASRF